MRPRAAGEGEGTGRRASWDGDVSPRLTSAPDAAALTWSLEQGQESIFKLAKDGQINAATAEAQRYLQANPNNAAAQYNLAVLLDASGNYQDALDLLNQAIRNAPKDYDGDMKQTVTKHLADAEAMSE